MRVALYTRVSTPSQDPTPQLNRLREWAKLNSRPEDPVSIEIEETDVASGRKVVRPGMERIMQAARGHRIHAVAVAKVDRWARSIQHLSATVNELHNLSVDFYAVDQGLTVRKRDPTSTLILNVLGSVAQWEASIISERTKDGLKDKPGRGRHWTDCGSEVHPCPTGKHTQTKGIQLSQGQTPPETPPSTNGRLIQANRDAIADTRNTVTGSEVAGSVFGQEVETQPEATR